MNTSFKFVLIGLVGGLLVLGGTTNATPGKLEIYHSLDFMNSDMHIIHYYPDSDALEGIDGHDNYYSDYDYQHFLWGPGFSICSLTSSRVHEYALILDVRPEESLSSVFLELALLGRNVHRGDLIEVQSKDEIRVRLPIAEAYGFDFGNKTITIQQYKPDNPNEIYPIFDIRKEIIYGRDIGYGDNLGFIALPDLNGVYGSQIPYAYFRVDFDRNLADFNNDKRVDIRDLAILSAQYGKTGNHISDIAISDPANGIYLSPNTDPYFDGYVDIADLIRFAENWGYGWNPEEVYRPVARTGGPYVVCQDASLDGQKSFDPHGSSIIGYEWDLDLSMDSNGDGNPANDVDATNPILTHAFPTGTTEISLITINTQGYRSLPSITTVNSRCDSLRKDYAEFSASQWQGTLNNTQSVLLLNDTEHRLVGEASIRMISEGSGLLAFQIPKSKQANADFSHADDMAISMSIWSSYRLERNWGSPRIRFHTTDQDYFEYIFYRKGQVFNLLSEADYRWATWIIPIQAGSAITEGWRRTIHGVPNLASIQYVEILVSNQMEGLVLCIDGIQIPGVVFETYVDLEKFSMAIESSPWGIIAPVQGTYFFSMGDIFTLEAIPDPYCSFINWSGTTVDTGKISDPLSPTIQVQINSNEGLRANFVHNPVVLTLSANPGGSVSPGVGNFVYAHGEQVSIQALPNPGIPFFRWIGSAVDTGKISDPYSPDITVTIEADEYLDLRAVFESIDYRWLRSFGSGSPGWGSGELSSPQGIAMDTAGNLYVAEAGNIRISVFDPDGNFPHSWGCGFQPAGLAIDSQGYLYVADPQGHRIVKYTLDGQYVMEWGLGAAISAIAVDSSDHVYVNIPPGSYANKIQKFTSTGDLITEWSVPGCDGVAVDKQGNVYTASGIGSQILRYSSGDGIHYTLTDSWGASGTKIGKLNGPGLVTLDSSGYVYVTEFGSKRIQVFTSDGKYLAALDIAEGLPGHLQSPTYVYIDEQPGKPNVIYVSDVATHTVNLYEMHQLTELAPPVIHWQFDANLLDSSEGQHHGTDIGGVKYIAGEASQFGTGALDLDGKSCVDIVGYAGISGTSPRTCTAWIKTTATEVPILCWGDSNTGGYWELRIDSLGQLRLNVNGGGISGSTVVNTGQWVHVATALPEGGDNTEDIQLYVNGIHQTNTTIQAYPINTGNTSDVWVGVNNNGWYYTGQIDDIRIYDYALSPEQVMRDYSPPTVRVTLNPTTNGKTSLIPGIYYVPQGDMVYIESIPDIYCVLTNWIVTHKSGKVTTLTSPFFQFQLTEDISIQPNFSYEHLRLTVTSTPGGYLISPQLGSYSNPPGIWIQLDAVALPRCRFVRWSGTAVQAGKVEDPTAPYTRMFLDYHYDLHAVFDPLETIEFEWIKTVGSMGSGDDEFFLPQDIAQDTSGNIYVSDSGNHRIQKFSREGIFLGWWGGCSDPSHDSTPRWHVPGSGHTPVAGSGDQSFLNPSRLTIDSQGNAYIADAQCLHIQKFTLQGDYVTQWNGGEYLTSTAASAMDLDSDGYNYLVFPPGDPSAFIRKFSPTGQLITEWNARGNGIAVDEQGNVYSGDLAQNRILRYTRGVGKDYSLADIWGQAGSGDGQINWVRFIAVDSASRIYVTEYASNRVQVFSRDGIYLGGVSIPQGSPGHLSSPSSICVEDEGNGMGTVYISDIDTHSVNMYKFNVTTQKPIAVANWRMDGDLQDSGVNQYHGSAVGNLTFTSEARVGSGSVGLDGVGSINIPGYKGIQGITPRTCSAWIKTTSTLAPILSWGSNVTGGIWELRVNSQGQLRLHNNGGGINSQQVVNTGQWVHVVVVLPEGGDNTEDIQLYVNGIRQTNPTIQASTINTGNAFDVQVGANPTGWHFKGQIDDVRIYNCALTGDEIQRVYEIR